MGAGAAPFSSWQVMSDRKGVMRHTSLPGRSTSKMSKMLKCRRRRRGQSSVDGATASGRYHIHLLGL